MKFLHTQLLLAMCATGASAHLRGLVSTLAEVGNNGDDVFPLSECQGDCDDDSDCQYGLVCFQRDSSNNDVPVPNCAGTANYGTDYCVVPADGQLVLKGDNGSPESVYAVGLGECEGECDGDSDCQDGLKCFQRDGYTEVPGCTGTGQSSKDYCYKPTYLEYIGNNDELDRHQLGKCEGDCDSDYDCQYGLVCGQRAIFDNLVTGCAGTPSGSTDYCIEPKDGELVLKGNDGIPEEAYADGLGRCEGECDSDSDCAGDLKCFQRSGTTPVPGCSGRGANSADYCYLPTKTPGTLNYVANDDEIGRFQLGLCEGDCDSDEDCHHGLVCFQKSSSGDGKVPGCDGEDFSSTDYCTYPWMENQLVVIGNNNLSQKLGVCQGDCSDDSDCEKGLICGRRRNDEDVDGCVGETIDEVDYCIVPKPGWLVKVGNNGSPSSKFPLGMCEGDCDSDSECDGDLVCRKRSSYEVIPGCEGFGISGTDYCGPVPEPGAKRIIAFGDVHGDVNAARDALKIAGVIDDNDEWIGGETQVVQTGDQIDRGTTERQVLDLFEDLRIKAQQAGGAFYPLIGNHEVMNAEQWLGDVSDEGFAEFSDIPYDESNSVIMSYPEWKRGRVAAFYPGGPYAKIIADHSVILQLEGSIFVHGGVLPTHVTYGIEQINTEISDWLRGVASKPDTTEIEDEKHPMWARHYSDDPDNEDCAKLYQVLEMTGMDRMVVGHTIQWDNGIHSDCDGKIWKIDVGLSSHYGDDRYVPPQVLEIVGDVITVLQ